VVSYLLLRLHVSALSLGHHQVSNCASEEIIHRHIYITAYSPRGYDVISQAYWAVSHQRHRENLTETISGLKPPRTSLFLLTTHSIAPYHAHFCYRTPKPDTTCDLNLYNRLSRYCQWLRYQQDPVAINTLYSLH